jgi:hypothetical protein
MGHTLGNVPIIAARAVFYKIDEGSVYSDMNRIKSSGKVWYELPTQGMRLRFSLQCVYSETLLRIYQS